MKQLIVIFISLFTINSFCQNDFTEKTSFKQKPNGELAAENFSFSYSNGKLTVTDMDLNIIKNHAVEFYNSSYSRDGNFYLVAYMSDLKKFDQVDSKKNFLGIFTFFYDKKGGALLKIKIDSILDDKTNRPANDVFYTEKGKEVIFGN
ncbi:hypothetical protein [Flavobacterium caeni]|uniref:Uncharacterized protein n=1 Tax=Flavobacterium caeni TaxID=490189 RepID=A0A1G5KJI4_9FLAO|nr:hypothetical protein [Flavobacterium caeni]SCZ00524.1 hypothetical protein SAMN02927903_03333 [Flavobacterium caeni]